MTRSQFFREQLRLAREKELRILAESRASADPRYVEDAIGWMWQQVLERKLRQFQTRNALPRTQRDRLTTLAELYS